MLYLAILVVVVGGLAVLAEYLRRNGVFGSEEARPTADADLPAFTRREFFMSKTEREFHDVLVGIVGPKGYRLFAQASLKQLVQLPKGSEKAQAWRNRIDRKTVDFVICEPRTLRPVLAIELDDSSHAREDRKARDTLVESILTKAGMPLLRWPCDPRGYKREEIAAAVANRLQPLDFKAVPSDPSTR
jgi:hypothetical protein